MIIHSKASAYIEARPDYVQETYLDVPHWGDIYPETINRAVIVNRDAHTLEVMVDHKTEGQVPNTITIEDAHTVRLEEHKPKFDAIFLNCFTPQDTGTLFSIEVRLHPRGIYKIIGPVVSPIIKKMAVRQITKYVLEPIKRAAELHGATK